MGRDTLYVIGNGLDLANGVRSSYRDFRSYLEGRDARGRALVRLLDSYLGSAPDLWGDFESSLAFLDRGMAMDAVDREMSAHPGADPSVSASRGTAGVRGMTRDLGPLFREWVGTLRPEGGVWDPPVPIDPGSRFISFNYTDVLESRYHVPPSNVMHIHGSVPAGDAVMGHGDDPSENLARWIESVRDLPSYRPMVDVGDGMVRNTRLSAQVYGGFDVRPDEWSVPRGESADSAAGTIEDWFGTTRKDCPAIMRANRPYFLSLHDVREVFVIGHSLSPVDRPYFERIIEVNDDPGGLSWTVCYRSRLPRAVGFMRSLGVSDVRYVRAGTP